MSTAEANHGIWDTTVSEPGDEYDDSMWGTPEVTPPAPNNRQRFMSKVAGGLVRKSSAQPNVAETNPLDPDYDDSIWDNDTSPSSGGMTSPPSEAVDDIDWS